MVRMARWMVAGVARSRGRWLLVVWVAVWMSGFEPPLAGQTTTVPPEPPARQRLSVAAARARAELLHQTISATLGTIHRSYFKDGETLPVPSRALEDVFYRLRRTAQIEVRWMAVNTPAMSLKHKPQNAFEKRAAAALARGQRTFVQVNQGHLRHVGAISLFTSCLKCHLPASPVKQRNRVAALVIGIPLASPPRGAQP
ncbi:MAG: hypothetical protein CMJ59_09515 [Planctomycetaceae bacterium]|nr:hypothetical protein [Planctomycetaceae bacterium]